jgi:2-methylisocitrate lyase-like PEP mutase family enzyme
MTQRDRLSQLLAERRLLLAPGVYDGLSARVAENSGAELLYVSGGAISRSMGYPDLGIATLTDVLTRTREVVDASRVPVVADIDAGYGGPLNVIRTVREFGRLGVAAVQLEDQVEPKRCGHYDGQEVVSTADMVQKVRAAVDEAGNDGPLVIARTDARAVTGLEDAIARLKAYAAAGAQLLFLEAPRSVDEMRRAAQELTEFDLVVNMFAGGKTPYVPAAELAELGYRLMIVPSDLQRAAIAAMRKAAEVLHRDGSTQAVSADLVTFAERETTINSAHFTELGNRYASQPVGAEAGERNSEGGVSDEA